MVEFIYKNNNPGGNKHPYGDLKLSIAACVALGYLFAVSSSDGERYRSAEEPSEKQLKFDRWDRSFEFFNLLGSPARESQTIKDALASLGGTDGLMVPMDRKLAVVVNAFNQFISAVDDCTEKIQGDSIEKKNAREVAIKKALPKVLTLEMLTPHIVPDEHGKEKLTVPNCGGIDFGKPAIKERTHPHEEEEEEEEGTGEEVNEGEDSNEGEGPENGDPSPEEIADAASKEREASEKRKKDKERLLNGKKNGSSRKKSKVTAEEEEEVEEGSDEDE
jgi:hypothetical protein